MLKGWQPVRSDFRLDIEGLRGIAVLLVVLYHAVPTVLPGGFVGVDVFFVISGYLITTQLNSWRGRPLPELLVDFYARRARRIFPALAIVLCVTLLLGYWFLTPAGEQQSLGKSGVSAALFASNIYFWSHAGDYFAAPSEREPLLHTWSLAVEEQFYLVWPIFLASLWALDRRLKRPRVVPIAVISVVLLSLVVSAVWTSTKPGAAFFLTPSRVWELGIGAALALTNTRLAAAGSALVGAGIGLVAIFVAALFFGPSTKFPGIAAMLPVGGAALVIASGDCDTPSPFRTLLSSRPLKLAGEVSYSWYLWHWPLLAIARVAGGDAHNALRDLTLVSIAFLLALASTRLIEAPIRRGQVRQFAGQFRPIATGCGLLAVASLASYGVNLSAQAAYAPMLPESFACMKYRGTMEPEPTGSCNLAEGPAGVLFLIGDSHANHWAPAIGQWARSHNMQATEFTYGGCPVPVAAYLEGDKLSSLPTGCSQFSASVMELIGRARTSGSAPIVVLAARWPSYLDQLGGQRFGSALDGAIDALERTGAKVLVLGPTPQFAESVPACLARRQASICRVARSEHDTKARATNDLLNQLAARHPRLALWDPVSEYCDKDFCVPWRGGVQLFRDEHHLSRQGALAALGKVGERLDALATGAASASP